MDGIFCDSARIDCGKFLVGIFIGYILSLPSPTALNFCDCPHLWRFCVSFRSFNQEGVLYHDHHVLCVLLYYWAIPVPSSIFRYSRSPDEWANSLESACNNVHLHLSFYHWRMLRSSIYQPRIMIIKNSVPTPVKLSVGCALSRGVLVYR